MLPETKSRSRATRLRAGQVHNGQQRVMSFPTELWNRKIVKARKSAKTRVGRFGMFVLEVAYSNVILERGFFFQRNPGKGDFEGLRRGPFSDDFGRASVKKNGLHRRRREEVGLFEHKTCVLRSCTTCSSVKAAAFESHDRKHVFWSCGGIRSIPRIRWNGQSRKSQSSFVEANK